MSTQLNQDKNSITKYKMKTTFLKSASKYIPLITAASGVAVATVGLVAASTSSTAAISAVGAVFGAGIGAGVGFITGASVGIVSGGTGVAATALFVKVGSITGAAIGGYAGPALALVGVGTAPAWAVPVVVAGSALVVVGVAMTAYQYGKSKPNSIRNFSFTALA
jgi:hypothetical protein